MTAPQGRRAAVAPSRGRHVVLIGMMGSGKTDVGQRVAARLGRPFLDNDEAVAARTGRSTAVLADERGLDALHAAEADVLLEQLGGAEPAVIAAAASTVVEPEVRDQMRWAGFVVWLRASPEVLARRLAADPGVRPRALVHDEARLRRLGERRERCSRQVADLLVDTGRIPPDQAADAVVRAYEAWEVRGGPARRR